MVVYPDTSFLFSIYVEEESTFLARAYATKLVEPLIFTPFHRLELRTALRLRVFRKELTHAALGMALRRSEHNLLDGFLRHTPLIWTDALREAERLGHAHLTEIGVRSGDLFHIASAVVLGATEFLTFDHRQTKLAQLAGLKVKTWKSTRR